MLVGVPISLGTATGLGTGTAVVNPGSDTHSGAIVLQPAGTPAAAGAVLITFPISVQGTMFCVAAAGGGPWTAPISFQVSPTGGANGQLNWYAGAQLTAGQVYAISYFCDPG